MIPLYYDRDADGLPRQLDRNDGRIDRHACRHGSAPTGWCIDYVRKCYLVAAGGLSSEMNRR